MINDGALGIAATGQQRHRAIADAPASYLGADGRDFAGTFEAENGGGAGRRRVKSLALHEVGAVERRTFDLDEQIGGAGHRVGRIAEFEDRFVAGFFDQDRFHKVSGLRPPQ